MLYALSKFITIPSISCDPAHREDCRQGAIWLRKCLGQLGAHTLLVCVALISLYGLLFMYTAVTDWRRKQPHRAGDFRGLDY